MKNLLLYTTLGCHLCQEAKIVLRPLLARFDLELVEVDIADDDSLVETYGIRIPVMRVEGLSEELGWPFDEVSAIAFFKRQQ